MLYSSLHSINVLIKIDIRKAMISPLYRVKSTEWFTVYQASPPTQPYIDTLQVKTNIHQRLKVAELIIP